MRRADGGAGSAQERAERGAGQEEDPEERQQHAEDRRPGRPDALRDEVAELSPDPAAVRGAEREHQPDDGDAEAEPERADGNQGAPRDDEAAERDQDQRRDVGGPADHAPGRIRHRPAAQAEPEHARQEDPERGEPEPDQLRVMVTGALLRPPPRLAGRRLRPRLRGARTAACLRHASLFAPWDRAPSQPGLWCKSQMAPRLRERLHRLVRQVTTSVELVTWRTSKLAHARHRSSGTVGRCRPGLGSIRSTSRRCARWHGAGSRPRRSSGGCTSCRWRLTRPFRAIRPCCGLPPGFRETIRRWARTRSSRRS